MFKNNLNFGFKSEMIVLGLLGLGVYSQSHEINLANNTTILLVLFLLYLEQEQIDDIKKDLYCPEKQPYPYDYDRCRQRDFPRSRCYC